MFGVFFGDADEGLRDGISQWVVIVGGEGDTQVGIRWVSKRPRGRRQSGQRRLTPKFNKVQRLQYEQFITTIRHRTRINMTDRLED
jgi:hypothetical protein